MLSNILSEVIEKYLGVSLEITNISLKCFKIKDFKAEPNMLNNLIMKHSNLKILEMQISELSLPCSFTQENPLIIKGVKLIIMPIKNNTITDVTDIKDINTLKDQNNSSSSQNYTTRFTHKIIDRLLSGFCAKISDIKIIIYNYEVDQTNLENVNPFLCLKIPEILLDKGKCPDNQYATQSGFGNKHFSISDIILSMSTDGENEKEIFKFNNDKGIHFYLDYNFHIDAEIGNIEFIVDQLQLGMIINFLDCYLSYIIPKRKIEKENKKEHIKQQQSEIDLLGYTINVKIDSLCLIIFDEVNYKQRLFGYDNLNYTKYDTNYFYLLVKNIYADLKEKEAKMQVNFLKIGYVEYPSIDSTEEDLESSIVRIESNYGEASIYEDAREENECFYSISICEPVNKSISNIFYDNRILLIEDISISFLKTENLIQGKVIKTEVDFHPAYLFKVSPLIFENTRVVEQIIGKLSENKVKDKKIETPEEEKTKEPENPEPQEISEINKNSNSSNFKVKVSINSTSLKICSFHSEKDNINNYIQYLDNFYDKYILNKESTRHFSLSSLTLGTYVIINISNIQITENSLKIEEIKIRYNEKRLFSVTAPLEIKFNKNEISINAELAIHIYTEQIMSLVSFAETYQRTLFLFLQLNKILIEKNLKNKKLLNSFIYENIIQENNAKTVISSEELNIVICFPLIEIYIINCENCDETEKILISLNNTLVNYNKKDSSQKLKVEIPSIISNEIRLSIEKIISQVEISKATTTKSVSISPSKDFSHILTKIKLSLFSFQIDPMSTLIFYSYAMNILLYSKSRKKFELLNNDKSKIEKCLPEKERKEELNSLIKFNISINTIKAIVGTKPKKILFIIADINLSNTSFKINKTSLLIEYHDQKLPKINIPLIDINNIDVSTTDITKQEIKSVYIAISDVSITFCKDSKDFIENYIQKIFSIISKIKFSKSTPNKTVIRSKKIEKKKKIEISNDYLNNSVQKVSESTKEDIDEIFSKKLSNSFCVTIGKVSLTLFDGEDFTVTKEFNSREQGDFELIESENIKYIPNRVALRIMLVLTEVSLTVTFETNFSYQMEFMIKSTEMYDGLEKSNFKRILSKKNIDSLNPITDIKIFISNSQNSLSVSKENDFNIYVLMSIDPLKIQIDQCTLNYVLNFIINNKEREINKKIPYEISPQKFSPGNDFETVSSFDVKISKTIEENEMKSFIYIKKFKINSISFSFTYDSENYTLNVGSKLIPVPSITNYEYTFPEISYEGYSTIDDISKYIILQIEDQISKSELLYNLFKSLNLTRPIANIIESFFEIFLTPYRSYSKGKSVLNGFLIGIKKFLFSIVKENVFILEKTALTLTTFIGVTKSSKIGKDSISVKYFSNDSEKVKDYFYK